MSFGEQRECAVIRKIHLVVRSLPKGGFGGACDPHGHINHERDGWTLNRSSVTCARCALTNAEPMSCR